MYGAGCGVWNVGCRVLVPRATDLGEEAGEGVAVSLLRPICFPLVAPFLVRLWKAGGSVSESPQIGLEWKSDSGKYWPLYGVLISFVP